MYYIVLTLYSIAYVTAFCSDNITVWFMFRCLYSIIYPKTSKQPHIRFFLKHKVFAACFSNYPGKRAPARPSSVEARTTERGWGRAGGRWAESASAALVGRE